MAWVATIVLALLYIAMAAWAFKLWALVTAAIFALAILAAVMNSVRLHGRMRTLIRTLILLNVVGFALLIGQNVHAVVGWVPILVALIVIERLSRRKHTNLVHGDRAAHMRQLR